MLFFKFIFINFIAWGWSYNFCAFSSQRQSFCGCRSGRNPIGPCVGMECPAGYMCVSGYCCDGCEDECLDCALYEQYCDNMNYCDLRQNCKATCQVCRPEDYDYDAANGDEDVDTPIG